MKIHGSDVNVDGGNEHIYSLRASDGTIVWSSPFPSQATRDLLVTERRVLVTNGRALLVINRVTGGIVNSLTQPHTSDPLFASAPGWSNGFVYVTVGDGVWCFREP